MLGFTEGIFLVLTVTEFILGNLVNGFIVSVNGSHWFKSKKISLSDFIITSLALFRIFLLWIILTLSVRPKRLRSLGGSLRSRLVWGVGGEMEEKRRGRGEGEPKGK